jgi:hypothetical protein
MEMNRRRDYLNSLSRADLQRLAKVCHLGNVGQPYSKMILQKCPGIKANWKSQTIRERILDPIYHIKIPCVFRWCHFLLTVHLGFD